SDLVGEIGELRLQARLLAADEALADVTELASIGERAVLEDTFAALETEIEAVEARVALLQLVDDSQRLQVVLEAAEFAHAAVQRVLAGVAEGRMPEVVSQRYSLDQRLVQRERPGDGARDLRHLDRMRHTRAVQITFVIDEHLRLVGQAP